MAVTVIDSGGDSLVDYGQQLVRYRDLLASLVRRDVALRYRQTLLGPAWILLQPLATAGVFTFLFGSVAKVQVPGDLPYFVFAIVSLSLWTGVSQTLTRSTNVLLTHTELITKVYFPRFLLPASAAMSALIDSVVMLALSLVIAVSQGVALTPRLLLTLPILAAGLMFSLCIAAVLSTILVRYRDVAFGLPLLVQLLLFLTPILYPVASVPEHLRPVVELNPLTCVIESFRWSVLGTAAPTTSSIIYASCLIPVLMILSLLAFSRLERDLADVI